MRRNEYLRAKERVSSAKDANSRPEVVASQTKRAFVAAMDDVTSIDTRSMENPADRLPSKLALQCG